LSVLINFVIFILTNCSGVLRQDIRQWAILASAVETVISRVFGYDDKHWRGHQRTRRLVAGSEIMEKAISTANGMWTQTTAWAGIWTEVMLDRKHMKDKVLWDNEPVTLKLVSNPVTASPNLESTMLKSESTILKYKSTSTILKSELTKTERDKSFQM